MSGFQGKWPRGQGEIGVGLGGLGKIGKMGWVLETWRIRLKSGAPY